jgi:putative membrane protein
MFHRGAFGFEHAHHPFVFALLVLLVLVGVIVVIVLVVRDRDARRQRTHASSVSAPSEAMRILDERFARGEIDDDEYRRRKAMLYPSP